MAEVQFGYQDFEKFLLVTFLIDSLRWSSHEVELFHPSSDDWGVNVAVSAVNRQALNGRESFLNTNIRSALFQRCN